MKTATTTSKEKKQHSAKAATVGRNILLTVSFLEGAAVMVVELLGAKIIAPYYGTSLYVWSSVLGVTLGALALGYFLGGEISRKYPGERSLFLVLLIAAFFSGIAPLIAPNIMYLTDGLGVRTGSLVSVLLYLLIPVSCLGTVSPIIIQLINEKRESAGKSAGTVYAVSTVGGILATFFAGFFLIPELGIRLSAFLTAGLLGGIALVYFVYARKNSLALSSVILLLMTMLLLPPHKESDQVRVLYSSTGILGEWKVVDYGDWKKEGNNQIERKLLLNGIDQTYTQTGFEPLSLWRYPHKLAAYASMKPSGSKALLLGMGGGSIAYELVAMGMDLDIVELDERLGPIAEEYFKYDPKTSNLYFDDARHFIRTTDETYDVVIIDLVVGEVQPAHVFSKEGFEELKKKINPDALVIINFQGTLDKMEYAIGPLSIKKTLEAVGFDVAYYSPKGENEKDINFTRDIFFVASLEQQNYEAMTNNLRYNKWFPYENFEYENLFRTESLDASAGYLLTDDQPRIELLNATAILNWRKNKIQQNVRKMLEEGVEIY